MKLEKRNYPYVLGHRGASGYAPENTLESFKMAIEMKADGVELDVQLTKDGQVVVCHDETIDRTSDHKGNIRDYTLAQLKTFNFNKKMKGYDFCQIPTFKEVLDLFKPTNCVINIELKTSIVRYEGIEEKTMQLVKEANMEDRVFYSSFNLESALLVKKLDPNAYVGYLYEDHPSKVLNQAIIDSVDAIHPHYVYLYNKKHYTKAKQNHLDMNVWTVNSKITMRKMKEMGITTVISNYPDIALKVCQGK